MGRAARWLRGLLGGGKKAFSGAPPPAKEKKRWGFSKTFKENDRGAAQQRPPAMVGAVEQRRGSYRDGATAYQTASMAPTPPPAATVDDEDEQNKHAIAVAAATAAVAEAAVAAAQAAAAVVRLTSSGRVVFGGAKREDWAAIKIQAAFRGYLARRALRALRGLVKLQALVRGNIVRKQAAETLRCMQALVRVQARARALRTEDARPKRTASLHPVSISFYSSCPCISIFIELACCIKSRLILLIKEHCLIGSDSKQLVKMKQGPPTPEKYEQATGGYALKSDRSSTLKRNSSKPVSVEFLEQDRLHSSGRNWLDRWMEERHWNSRVLAARTAMVSGIDDEKSAKILEIDPGKPQHKPNSRSHHLNSSCSTLASDLNSHSFTSVQASPSKDSTTAQLSVPSPSSVDMPESLSPLRFHAAVEAADPADSPQFYSASSRPGSARKGPYTPSQSDCSRSMFSGCSYNPNYMANTESSRAKARSQSAPKQRPEIEKSGSVKRILVHHGFGLQQQASSATTQRSSSLHSKFTNKAYPGSGRLDRLGMPLGM